ncbi:MAG: hypothetical protein Q7T57_08450, partial [Dehalococcoidales bacterium]|nr:hypothetical protein [Dehalococcoidales bacterium]
MTLHPYFLYSGKVASVAVAGAAALFLSLLTAFYVVALCGSSLQGTTISVVFGAVALAMLAVLAYGFSKLSWPHRMLIGAALLACSF